MCVRVRVFVGACQWSECECACVSVCACQCVSECVCLCLCVCVCVCACICSIVVYTVPDRSNFFLFVSPQGDLNALLRKKSFLRDEVRCRPPF